MSTLFTQDYSRVLTIGIGSLGCQVARLGDECGDDSAAIWSAAHVDSTELIATGLERKLFLKMCDGPFAARSLAHSLEENAATLERLSRGRDIAILCGELSDARAMLMLETLSTALSDLNVAVFAIVIEPFSPDRASPAEVIAEQLDTLSGAVPFVAALNPGMENVSAGIAMKRVRKIAAERLAAGVECFANALSSDAECAHQLKMHRGLHHAVYAASAQSSGSIVSVDAALRSFDDESVERIQVAIVSTPAEMSFRETKAIARKLPESAVIIPTSPLSRNDVVECMLLSGQERSANIISMGEAQQFAMAD